MPDIEKSDGNTLARNSCRLPGQTEMGLEHHRTAGSVPRPDSNGLIVVDAARAGGCCSKTSTWLHRWMQTAVAFTLTFCIQPPLPGDEIDVLPPAAELEIPPIKMVSLSQISGAETEEPLAPAATMFIKGIVLAFLPETYADDDDWGGTKKIQSGLNVKLDGLKLNTSRRWKELNQGTWQRIDATLVDPEQHFDLTISLLPKVERGVPRYRVRARLRLRAAVRQQQWNLGVKLYSLSADVVADVAFTADLHFRTELVKSEDNSKLRVLPHIENATAYLEGFSLRSLGHSKGGHVREFGKVAESIIKRSIKKKNVELATKINGKIKKKPERFEVPAGILAIFGEPPVTAAPEAAAKVDAEDTAVK